MTDQNLVHHGKVVTLVDRPDFEAAIVVAVRPAVLKGDEAGDGELAENVRDIESDDARRRVFQPQRPPQRGDRLFSGAGARQFGAQKDSVPFAEHRIKIGHHVAQVGGFLEAFGGGGLRHLRPDYFRHFSDISLQNGDSTLNPLPVFLRSNRADAGGAAVFDDAFEAAFAGLLVRLGIAAGAQPEVGEQEVERHPQRSAVGEGAEILRPVVFADAGQLERREFFAAVELEQQIALVVAHQDIVIGGVLLDQPGFEDQRFALGPHHFKAPLFDRIDERPQFGVGAHDPRGLEVGTHPLAQVGRLADVDDLAGPVPVDVDAGLGRNFRWVKLAFAHEPSNCFDCFLSIPCFYEKSTKKAGFPPGI